MNKKIVLIAFLIGILNANTITSIEYNGLVHLSPESANEISGLRIGGVIDKKTANEAILNLYKQGYFKDIFIEENAGRVVVNLVEKPVIAKIELQGVATNDKDNIMNVLGIKKGQMYDELSLKTGMTRIKQYFQARSYFDTVVTPKIEPVHDNNSSLALTLVVNRGEKITINNVHLIGSDVLKYSKIEPAISNKEREFMGWMWGRNDGAVKIFELPGDPQKIKDEYLNKGYLDANVSNPFLNTDFSTYDADLSYFIQEGEKFTIKNIQIQAPEFLELDTDDLIDDMKLEQGDVAKYNVIKKDAQMLENIVADKGYAFVKVYPQFLKDYSDNSINLIYHINPGEKVYIRNVTITGNDKTVDRVVRRELYLTEGNLYSKTDLDDSRSALKRTGYFEEVEIKEERIDETHLDLEIVVKETGTGSITGGIGYGSSDGLLLNFGVSESNLFGSGYKGGINIDRSDDSLAATISLRNPRVMDSPYSLGGSIFANKYEWNNWEEKNYGFSITGGRMLTRHLNAFLSYELQKSEITGLNEFYRDAGYLNGTQIKSAVIPGLSWDNTDDYYIPRSGFSASEAVEFAMFGPDIKFIRNSTKFNFYQGLSEWIEYDLIFRYKASFGYFLHSEDDKLPINEKLFLGGISTIRGFDSRSVSPKTQICDPVSESGVVIPGCRMIDTGGKMAFNNSVELSFPIFNRIKMRGLLFFDYGLIGNERLDEINRYSTGFGIEWITMLGPLQLIFAKPLNDQPGDETSVFEFNIGRRF
nr:outer membrane protein assembly factor BamA [Campylobacter sp.]